MYKKFWNRKVCKTKNIFLIEQQINVYALPKKNYTKSESLKVGKY